MIRKLYIWIVFVLGAFFNVSCADDTAEMSQRESELASLSVSEAKEFFENSFTSKQTRSSGKERKRALVSGEFTPQWKSAQTSQDKEMWSVDIALLTEYRHKALRRELKNGKFTVYAVDVTQKLIVLKNKRTEAKVQYLLSLIPDKDYYKKNKGDLSAKFIHAGEKNGYSGLTVYAHASSGRIISVGKYKDGSLIANVYLPSGKGTLESRIEKVNQLLGDIKLPRIKSSTTRSFGESGSGGFNCSICGEEAESCICVIIEDDCLCGNCDLCGWGCPWCGNNPCTCGSDLYCPTCGCIICICDEPVAECVYCGIENCSGECQNNSCGGCGICADCAKDNETHFEQFGRQALNKIENDLKSGNVKIQQVKMNGRDAQLTAAGVGLNTNGLITSCTSFIKNAGPLAGKLGNAVSGAGLIVGTTQTYIGFSDGDITTADKLNAISTALSAAGLICVLIPGGQVVSGVLGVASCVVGIVSVFYTHNMPNEIHLKFDDGTSFHMCLIA